MTPIQWSYPSIIMDCFEKSPLSFTYRHLDLCSLENKGWEKGACLRRMALRTPVNVIAEGHGWNSVQKLSGEFPLDVQSVIDAIHEKRVEQQTERRKRWAQRNEWHAWEQPMIGHETITYLQHVGESVSMRIQRLRHNAKEVRSMSPSLVNMILTPDDRITHAMEWATKIMCYVPTTRVSTCSLTVQKRNLNIMTLEMEMKNVIQQQLLTPLNTIYYNTHKRTQLFFPDKRLIQFDCGKLQALDKLLRKLKSGKHRCLIFTQMSSMLNVLERFLSLHG